MPKKGIGKNPGRKVRAIGLVYPPPLKWAGGYFSRRLADLIKLLESPDTDIFIITGIDLPPNSLSHNKVHVIGNVKCADANVNPLSYIWDEVKAQARISRSLMTGFKDVELIVWRARASTIVVPLLLAKLKGKRAILFVESNAYKLVREFHRGPLAIQGIILSIIYRLIEGVTHSLSDRIVVNVPGLLNQLRLTKYKEKVFPFPASDVFIDHGFRIVKPLNQRRMLVGYIGRMSQEKGILNLVKAIPLIQSQLSQVEFLLVGDGPLFNQVNNELRSFISEGRVKVPGWISNNKIPGCLNEMKLLILPSYYEGLPAIVSEAMACGTPVVATPVGAIPDRIKDSETGFIMEDNSPECITKNVIRALNYPELDTIAANAQALVGEEHTYEVMKERWHQLLTSINSE